MLFINWYSAMLDYCLNLAEPVVVKRLEIRHWGVCDVHVHVSSKVISGFMSKSVSISQTLMLDYAT